MKIEKIFYRINVLWILWIIFMGAVVFGEGVVRDSIGPTSSGRGGVNLGFDDNLSLINDNPAGLATMDQLRFELDLDLLHVDVNYRDPQNDKDGRSAIFALPTAAVSWRALEAPRPVTVGLGFFLPAGFGNEFRLTHPAYGSQKYLSEASLMKILPVASVDLGGGLSVGGGIGPTIEMAKFETPFTFQTGALAGTPVLAATEMDGIGFAWNIGLQYRPTDRWTIGLAYISESRMELEGTFSVNGTGVLPLPDATASYDAKLVNTWPRSAGLGTAYRFDWGSLSMDVLWFDWSAAFDDLTFLLANGSNPAINGMVGPAVTDTFALNWDDSWTVRLGTEIFITPEDTVRLGYIFISNPVPNSTLTSLIPAILEHSVTIGYGRKFGAFSVDLAYQFSFGHRQSVGTSAIVGGDFDQSSLRTMAHWVTVGVKYNF